MEKTSSKSFLLPVILALCVLVFAAYLMYSDLKPTRVEHEIRPAINLIETSPITVITPTTAPPSAEQEADAFVKNLVTTDEFITINENEDKFVRNDSIIVLPELEYLTTTKKALLADKTLPPDTPISLSYVTDDKVETTLAEIGNTVEDRTSPITIITPDGTQIISPLTDLLHLQALKPDTVITRVVPQKHRIDTTIEELKKIDIPADQPLMATITRSSQAITLKDLTQSKSLPDDALFYLHRVTERDVQGLWGIIQTGLIDEFKRGVQLEGITPNQELIQTIIPEDADEKLPSGVSSFLGKVLKNKVDSSYVYNLKTHSMGHDVNLIFPGQQLILIHFPPNELKQIYQFFSEQHDQNIETFAIPN